MTHAEVTDALRFMKTMTRLMKAMTDVQNKNNALIEQLTKQVVALCDVVHKIEQRL